MKNKLKNKIINFFFFAALFQLIFAPFVSSVPDLEIKKLDKGSVVISEVNNPAIFDFTVDNKGASENFEIYSLVGVSMSPKGRLALPHGEITLTVYAYPNEEVRKRAGFFNFEYQLKGQTSGIFKDTLLIKIVPLAEVLEIKAEPTKFDDKKVKLTVRNKENTNLENVDLKFSSVLFSGVKQISLKPYESISFEIPVAVQEKTLSAGSYVLTTEVKLENKKVSLDNIVDFLEEEKIATDEKNDGFFVRRTTIKKTNIGNVATKTSIEVKKDIVSRLFTVNSPESLATRSGLFVTYIWEKELAPDEFFEIETKTNYVFPFIIAIMIVVAGLLAKIYSQNAVSLKKNVSFVRTKGGEFALKVKLHVKARNYTTNIQVMDTIPAMAKLYEEFGKKPDKIDDNKRKLIWKIDKLSAGEERVYSYIVYSKLKVVGRFELPSATAVFEKDGRIEEVWSNRTFFVAETSVGEKI